ncbi:MAG: LicD family protein, partial [Cellvibrionales bacterium]|nr:LicD family protein [Cellvibrionales bacterium]
EGAKLVPFQELIVDPLTLVILSDLIRLTVEAFDESGISYFSMFGTQLSIDRFHYFMPWDDDSDFGFYLDELKQRKEKFFNALSKRGLYLYWDRCLSEEALDICKVFFTEQGLRERMHDWDSTVSEGWVEKVIASPLTWVDLFPLEKNGQYAKHLVSWWFNLYNKNLNEGKGYLAEDLKPSTQGEIHNFKLNESNNVNVLYEIWFNDRNPLKKWSMYNHKHYDGFDPLVLDNIEMYPEFEDLIYQYLHFVFD